MGKKLGFGLLVILTAFILSQCGKESGTGGRDSNTDSDLSYSYEEIGICKTGVLTFKSQQALCEGLRSKQLNKNCARQSRKADYERMCGGAFLETP